MGWSELKPVPTLSLCIPRNSNNISEILKKLHPNEMVIFSASTIVAGGHAMRLQKISGNEYYFFDSNSPIDLTTFPEKN